MCLAVPGKILEVQGDRPLERRARVSFGGVVKDISLAYVPDAQPGQYVVVHVGFALSVVDEEQAQKVLAEFDACGLSVDELMGEPETTTSQQEQAR